MKFSPHDSRMAFASWSQLASTLNDEQWNTKISSHDGRTVGVVVHHVGTMYPIEIDLAQKLAAGQAVEGVTWDAVHELNANHAREHATCTKEEAIELVQRNSRAAAAAVRALSDAAARQRRRALAQLRRAAHLPVHARGSRRRPRVASPHEDQESARRHGSHGANGGLTCISSLTVDGERLTAGLGMQDLPDVGRSPLSIHC